MEMGQKFRTLSEHLKRSQSISSKYIPCNDGNGCLWVVTSSRQPISDRKQSNHLDAAKVDSELLHYIHNTYKLSFLEPTLKTFGRKTGWAKRFLVVCCMGEVNLETAACDGTMEDVD